MSGITVTYQLAPRRARPVAPEAPSVAELDAPKTRRGDRTVRRLALAHRIEALVEDGVLHDYAAAARMFGLTRGRMTQVMNLLLLAPEIQERSLLGTLAAPERRLRLALRSADWEAQMALTT